MIETRDLHIAFGSHTVLRGVDISVPQGESLAVIGGSGTGKSVLLKCILGLMKPNRGDIIVDGQTVTQTDRRSFLPRFGMLFQGAALFDSLPIWQNVSFRMLHDGMPRPKARTHAIETLARVGLGADVADLYPAELSGGMQKRAGLARAIAADPDILFLDEPTTGLDPIMSGVINDLIREILDDIGATAITITHDMTSVRRIADRVAMLHDGQVQWTGAVSDLDSTTDPYVTQFVAGSGDGPIARLR